MRNGLIKRFFKYVFKLTIPLVGIWCLIEYWKAELIVDKIHYGVFMLAMLIVMCDNMHNNGGGKIATS